MAGNTPTFGEQWGGTIGAGVATVGNIISTYMSNKANAEEAEKDRKFQELMAQRANDWSIQQWNRENAYNDPTAQMERLKRAGLNPNLVFSNGSLNNSAAPSPSVQMASGSSAAGSQRPYILDPLTAAQVANINADTRQKEKSLEVSDAQINQLNATASNLKKQTDVLQKELDLKNIDYLVRSQTYLQEISAKNAQYDLSANEAKAKAKYVEDTAKKTYDILVEEYNNIKKDGKLKDADIDIKREIHRKEIALANAAEDMRKKSEVEAEYAEFSFWFDKALAAGELLTNILNFIAMLSKLGMIKKGNKLLESLNSAKSKGKGDEIHSVPGEDGISGSLFPSLD